MPVLRSLFLVFIFILAIVTSSPAGPIPSELVANLSPLDGVIVMPIDGDYLIDLDASKGVVEGDIFSVIIPGKNIIHPLTGKIIGSLDKVTGWLEVTHIKHGYSYAHPLDSKTHFTKGTLIRRYEDVPAVFWDYSGHNQTLFNQLRAALPQLEWHSYAADQASRPAKPAAVASTKPILTFIIKGDQLQVKGLNFSSRGQYPLNAANSAPAANTGSEQLPAIASTVPIPLKNSGIMLTAPQKKAGGIIRIQRQDTQNIWTAAEWSDNPNGIEIADFNGDGTNDVAILLKDSLEIGQIKDRAYHRTNKLPLRGISKALTLSSADLDGNGQPELLISAMNGSDVSSLVVNYKNGTYQIAQGNLPWFLRAVLNPDGSKTVLGQRLGNRVDIFAPQIVKIEFHNGAYVSAGEYGHPWQTNVFSLQPFRDATGVTHYAEISSNDHLRVFNTDAQVLWESSKRYGGSQIYFTAPDKAGGRDADTKAIYLKPRLALLNHKTILAPLNEGWRISKTFQSMGPGQVSALQWDGNSLVELWHTKPQSASLSDFQYADIDNDHKPEVVLLLQYKSAGLLSNGRAGLKVFEIN